MNFYPTPPYLIAFPSVASSLDSLPQATNLATVRLHPTIHALRAAESEAKLRRALASKLRDHHITILPPPSRSPVSHTDYGLVMLKSSANQF
ncbi:hypothetical protein BDN72DRAFT_904870 [Pluteus cervinus]|uniref:Uncharacterized protein n=1 Tax=Pluteus cervinus TaxID=181527 RepID=A0ACD3A552_9AGAR|nr:hypothetical protein BDN72DRAFT_904870 [Pluteus cervinus]